ncbi:TetR/AcrR family transcriptional regulator [Kribbella qitaiheensis]|uniref:TetR/AcrR family transcriptional regulator n=1 Tax=Kribbella qitaiheensis TaxID=1544730 RepID=A0A7G6WV11_9ACTN|nr:TetR family transcriptional regulator [Kribbella qitaiheensis]QNE17826.1 TetR/AcrR family transcriptional regulator [Kribbella qitaiheensis]
MERALTAKGAATRQRIVEGAALLIREQGVPNVGLEDIRMATATSKSQLFHYFPAGKADLMLSVAAHEAELVIAEQMPHLGDLTSWRKWQAWRRRVVQIYDAQRQRCTLSALTAQLGTGDPATREIVTTLLDRWQGYLVAGVQALKDSGEADPGIDPLVAATSILTAITGGAGMLQATDRISYLDIALTDTIEGLRRPTARTRRKSA